MPGMGVARKEATLLEGPRAVNKSVQIGAPETREPPDATVRGLTTTTGDAERAAQTLRLPHLEAYIMPPIPPGGMGGVAGFSSGFSATIASVVSSSPATDAAFSSAVRTTFVG